MGYKHLILFILVVSSGIFYYNITGADNDGQMVFVERVIDGDTVKLDDGMSVRLLGINTPEHGKLLSEDAKNFTESLVLNRSVVLLSSEMDRYGRRLGYVFIGDKLLNEELVRRGLAHLYYYGTDEYYDRISSAEKYARENGLGIWKHSKNYGCIEIVNFRYLDISKDDTEQLILKNNCDVNLDITIKDDATHIYQEKILAGKTFEKDTKDIWNDDGDSLYIWDDQGLVYFERYD